MNRKFGAALLGFGALGVLGASSALADSLLLKDGRLISGQVTHTDSGYVVHTRSGDMKFGEDQVEHWTHAESADPSETAVAPPAAPPAATGAATGTVTPPVPAPASPAFPAGAAPTAPRGRDRATVQKTIAALLARGNDALAAGDYKAARDSFADVLVLEPGNVLAAQGAGYAYLQLNNYAKARDVLEIAYAGVHPPPRALACNLAVALGKTRNPMRAAKVLKEYLVAHPQPLDEPALNALAATLFQADETTRRNAFFAQVGQFYDDYNKKLEATRSGEKRWGSQWLPAAEADRKLKTYNAKRTTIETLNKRVANARAAFYTAAHNAEDAIASSHLRQGAAANVPLYKQQMAEADAEHQLAQKELARAMEGFEQPPIDEALAIVMPELGLSTPTAVASATPGATVTPAIPGAPGASASAGSSGTPHGVKPVQVAVAAPTGPGNAGPPKSLFGPDSTGTDSGGTAAPASSSGTPRPGTATPGVITATRAEPPAPTRKLRIQTDAVAFPVAPDLLVTTAEAADKAQSITVQLPDGLPTDAEVVSSDAASGLALVRLKEKKVAYLPLADSFAGGPVTSVGFPEVSLFDPVAAIIAGTAGNKATGAEGKWTVNLTRSPRLGGGPLLVNGKVVGVQLANRDSERGNIPFATLDDLKRLLSGNLPPAGSGGGADARSLTMQLTATRERR